MGLRFVFCFQHGQGPVMAHCFSVSIEISIVQLGMYIYVVILFHETVILLIKMKKCKVNLSCLKSCIICLGRKVKQKGRRVYSEVLDVKHTIKWIAVKLYYIVAPCKGKKAV